MAEIDDDSRFREEIRNLSCFKLFNRLLETAEKIGRGKAGDKKVDVSTALHERFIMKWEFLGRIDLPEMRSEVPY